MRESDPEMELLRWFSDDVACLITSYCDLGDKDDKAIFDSLPEARVKWLTAVDFREETFCAMDAFGDSSYYRQTSIAASNGKRILHSIDDRACLVISREPVVRILATWEDGERADPFDNPMMHAVWGRLGLIHRDDNYAYIRNSDDSPYWYTRVWARNGKTRDPRVGHSIQCIYKSPAGRALDCWQWRKPGLFPILKFLRPGDGTKFMTIALFYSMMASQRLHRDDGPAIICVPRNEKEKKEQPLMAEEGEYGSYDGIRPRHEWYLDGFPISRSEHARITARLHGQP